MTDPTKVLREFVDKCRHALDRFESEADQLGQIKPALKTLHADQQWLPATHRKPRDDRYAQYPVYVAPVNRFSIVSFVWKPGQWTPIHDHTDWGVIGIYQGIERTEIYRQQDGVLQKMRTLDCGVGEVGAVSPTIGDIHKVGNVSDETAISIHVYGGNIGKIERHVFDEDGSAQSFVSGYEPAPVLLD